MWDTWVQSLHQEDPVEKGIATHSSILAWESHGRRRLAGNSPWGRKESGTTEQLTLLLFMYFTIVRTLNMSCTLSACRALLTICTFKSFSSVQSLSRVWLFATLWIAARQASLSITNSRSSISSRHSLSSCSYSNIFSEMLFLPSQPS